jgi:phosphoglycolate phosphatase
MTELEVAPVATAEPIPYGHEVIASARESGRTIGVVSNNSPRAIKAYPGRHDLGTVRAWPPRLTLPPWLI